MTLRERRRSHAHLTADVRPRMTMSARKGGWITGSTIFLVHSALATLLFVDIQLNRGAQAEMAWLLFMLADIPTSYFAWEFISQTAPFRALFEWGYTFGSGPNLRAFVIHLLFGGVQWLAIGWLFGFLFWPKTGWFIMWRARSNLSPQDGPAASGRPLS